MTNKKDEALAVDQTFTGLPKRKLVQLLEQSWRINGVSIERTEQDGTVHRGAVIAGGMVLWWNQEQPAQQRQVPDWISYDKDSDVLTIHGRRYSAALFDERGFGSPPGTQLRIVDGPSDVVTLEWMAEQPAQVDPCPGCRKGGVCRTPKCGRLKLPADHPLRSEQPAQDEGQSCYCPNCEALSKQVTALKTCLEVERGFHSQEQPAQQQEPVAWRELCRRLYFELYWCDRQMMETLDENGEPMWTQGKTVRDVLADAKAALDTSPPASKPWVSLTDDEVAVMMMEAWGCASIAPRHAPAFAQAIKAKLREKNT